MKPDGQILVLSKQDAEKITVLLTEAKRLSSLNDPVSTDVKNSLLEQVDTILDGAIEALELTR
jgi:hypothetical protein